MCHCGDGGGGGLELVILVNGIPQQVNVFHSILIMSTRQYPMTSPTLMYSTPTA